MELGFDFTAMACHCEIRLQGPHEAALRTAADRAIAEVRRIEAKYSRYRADSVVARINAAAGTGVPVPVDAETAGLLDFADTLHALSGGRFDVTSGVLRRCWDFRSGRIPDARAVGDLLPLVGASRVQREARGVALPQAGMEIDLGGVGKEYACDRAAAVLADLGIARGWVNLGGDLRVLGPRADGSAWDLGIQHPRQPQAVIARVALRGGALATSGDYERFIEQDGRRYSHLLDARTGWPVSHWQSASVIGPTCTAAGAAATLACLLGPQAPDFLAAQGVDWCLVDAAGELHFNPGWREASLPDFVKETSP